MPPSSQQCVQCADRARGCLGLSRPMHPDHAEQAVMEQVQCEAVQARREGYPSIPIPQRLLTMAPFLQPSLSTSSSASPSPGMRLALTRTTRLAFLRSVPSTIICSRSTCCLGCCLRTCSPLRGPSIPAPGNRAAPAQVVEPASLVLYLPLSGAARLPAAPARPLPAMLAVTIGPSHPSQPRHCTSVVGPLISDSESTAFKLTVTRQSN